LYYGGSGGSTQAEVVRPEVRPEVVRPIEYIPHFKPNFLPFTPSYNPVIPKSQPIYHEEFNKYLLTL
jgi:hypothetical protein